MDTIFLSAYLQKIAPDINGSKNDIYNTTSTEA